MLCLRSPSRLCFRFVRRIYNRAHNSLLSRPISVCSTHDGLGHAVSARLGLARALIEARPPLPAVQCVTKGKSELPLQRRVCLAQWLCGALGVFVLHAAPPVSQRRQPLPWMQRTNAGCVDLGLHYGCNDGLNHTFWLLRTG